jgi:hypothetical protein
LKEQIETEFNEHDSLLRKPLSTQEFRSCILSLLERANQKVLLQDRPGCLSLRLQTRKNIMKGGFKLPHARLEGKKKDKTSKGRGRRFCALALVNHK